MYQLDTVNSTLDNSEVNVPSRTCIICGKEIPDIRLEFVPDTKLCVAHAKEAEAYGGEFLHVLEESRTSKQGSLKQSYGSASQVKLPNPDAITKLRENYKKQGG